MSPYAYWCLSHQPAKLCLIRWGHGSPHVNMSTAVICNNGNNANNTINVVKTVLRFSPNRPVYLRYPQDIERWMETISTLWGGITRCPVRPATYHCKAVMCYLHRMLVIQNDLGLESGIHLVLCYYHGHPDHHLVRLVGYYAC